MSRIAIVGAGISGLTAALRLSAGHDVHVFESNDSAGGHTHTVPVRLGERSLRVDTGFVVFNERAYPLFCELLAELGVESQPAPMTFSVSCERTGIEWGGARLDGLFAQRLNLLRPRMWRMLAEIRRFGLEAKRLLREDAGDEGLEDYLRRNGYSETFRALYMLPMAAAIWSSDPREIATLPARFFVRFFDNHGMLDIRDAPYWLAVRGGSATYVERMARRLDGRLHLSTAVTRIVRHAGGVEVRTAAGAADRFDAVVVATHSDQALRLLAAPSPAEREILGAIRFRANDVVLHTDRTLLPRSERAWASWNYRVPASPAEGPTVTYYMNSLQSFEGVAPVLVTLNGTAAIRKDAVLRRFTYDHPVFTPEAVAAQARVSEISGQGGVHFCGAYWGYGFHEDGAESARRVVREVERARQGRAQPAVGS